MTKTGVILVFFVLIQQDHGQEWPHYGADPGAMRYSPLDQINRTNVTRLEVAWTYRTGDMSDGTVYPTRSALECTPIVIDGVMYVSTPFSRVVALDPESGKELWSFEPKIDKKAQCNLFVNRGVAVWCRGVEKRVFVGTLDGRLFALNAADGKPVKSFGENGLINLRAGFIEPYPNRTYGMTSPPLIYRDLVITGSVVSD